MSSTTQPHPLVVRLKQIVRQLRKSAKRTREDRRFAPRSDVRARAFCDGLASMYGMTADLIEDAVKAHPLKSKGGGR